MPVSDTPLGKGACLAQLNIDRDLNKKNWLIAFNDRLM